MERLTTEAFHERLWTGGWRFYLSLPLDRRPAYRRLIQVILQDIRHAPHDLALHLSFLHTPEGAYRWAAEEYLPDLPWSNAVGLARQVAYYLIWRRIRRHQPLRRLTRGRRGPVDGEGEGG